MLQLFQIIVIQSKLLTSETVITFANEVMCFMSLPLVTALKQSLFCFWLIRLG